jgi:hypothetical protein
MSWYDRFNDWYVRSIPEDDTRVVWWEPIAASRFRWRSRRLGLGIGLAIAFPLFALALHARSHGRPGLPWEWCLGISALLVAILWLVAWLSSFAKSLASITQQGIGVGANRSRRWVLWQEIRSITPGEDAGFSVLLVRDQYDRERTRLYLTTESKDRVFDFLRKMGKL